METPWTYRLTRTEQALLILLRCGLWEREPAAIELSLFPLNHTEWKETYHLASAHTVIGLVFQGICSLPESLMPPPEQLSIWVASVDRIERTSRNMNRVVEQLLCRYQAEGLHPILLKGQGIAAMYAQPLLRSCGDIDLYFPSPAEDSAAKKLATSWGAKIKTMDDGALLYNFEGIEVEQHRHMLDIINPFCQKSVQQLIDTESTYGHLPSALTNLLLLNTHLLKHIIGPGVGLRQFADMARACFTLYGKYEKTNYYKFCKQWNITVWSRQLNTILVHILGLPIDYLPSQETDKRVSDRLLRKILQGGNFGKYHEGNEKTSNGLLQKKFYTIRHSLGDFFLSFSLSSTETIFFLLHLIMRQKFRRTRD